MHSYQPHYHTNHTPHTSDMFEHMHHTPLNMCTYSCLYNICTFSLYYTSSHTPAHSHRLFPHPCHLVRNPVYPHMLTHKAQLTYTSSHTTSHVTSDTADTIIITPKAPTHSLHSLFFPNPSFHSVAFKKHVYVTYVKVRGPCVGCPDHTWPTRC